MPAWQKKDAARPPGDLARWSADYRLPMGVALRGNTNNFRPLVAMCLLPASSFTLANKVWLSSLDGIAHNLANSVFRFVGRFAPPSVLLLSHAS